MNIKFRRENNKRISWISLVMFYTILVFLFLSFLNVSIIQLENKVLDENGEDYNFNRKTSPSQIIDPFIVDDDDAGLEWAIYVMNYSWCTGSGTSEDPYKVEDVIVDATGFNYGIWIYDSTVNFELRNVTIIGNMLINGHGIRLTNVKHGKILNCNCSNTSWRGIYLENTNNTLLSENIANDNQLRGIELTSSSSNRIIGNNLERNGMAIFLNSDNNTIYMNSVRGIFVSGSDDNTIYLNMFISDSGDDAFSQLGTNNQWNNSYIGNYYQDYIGEDIAPEDGIGDLPYNIPGISGEKDYFPIFYHFNLDTDADGLINEEEYLDGEDGYKTNVTNPDSDYDGLNDYQEWLSGTDPWDPDSDSDAFDDFTEVSLGTDPNMISWYPMPNLRILSFSVSDVIEGNPFTLDFTIQNNGIWKAEGIIVIIRCEALDLTLYDNTAEPFDLEVDESKHILSDNSGISAPGSYSLTLNVDPSNLILETYSSKDGSYRTNWELDNSEQIGMSILPSEGENGLSERDLLGTIATVLSIIGGTFTVLGIFYKTVYTGKIKPKKWAKDLTSSREEKVRFHAASKLKKSKNMKKVVISALQKAAYDETENKEIRNLAKEALKERGILVKD